MRSKLDPSRIITSSPRSGGEVLEFNCENEHINHWFRQHSVGDHDGFDCSVKHFFLSDDPQRLAGFFCLGIGREPQSDFVGASFVADRLFDQDRITTVQLRWFAVRSGLERRGLGSFMMGPVIDAAYSVIKAVGAHAVTVQYMGSASRALYTKFGFIDYADESEKKLYLPAQAVIDLVEDV